MDKQRDRKILAMREAGISFASIGLEFGICVERARQIYLKMRYLQERYERWPWLRQLSSRSQNGLRTHFGGTEVFDHPELIAKEGKVALSRVLNIGKKSVAEIGSALQRLGLLDDVDDW